MTITPAPGAGEPLSIGNVINTGFRLYGAKFKEYVGIAAGATLGLFFIYLAIALAVVAFAVAGLSPALLGILIPAAVVAFFYAMAQYASEMGLISRLAFGELTEQPEAVEAARRVTRPRKWQFLLNSVLVGLIFVGVFLPFYILLLIMVVAVFGFTITGGGSEPGVGAIIAIGLLILVMVPILIVLVYWLWARLFAAEVPLAIEPGVGASKSIGRIWSLTKGSTWRIALIAFVISCIMLPVSIVTQLIASFLQIGLTVVLPEQTSGVISGLSTVLGSALGLLINIVVLPLWQVMKSVIYLDLRTRREGFGLELRDRRSEF